MAAEIFSVTEAAAQGLCNPDILSPPPCSPNTSGPCSPNCRPALPVAETSQPRMLSEEHEPVPVGDISPVL